MRREDVSCTSGKQGLVVIKVKSGDQGDASCPSDEGGKIMSKVIMEVIQDD